MKPAKYYIDAAMLRKRGACPGQIELFVRTFGEGRVPIDERHIDIAISAGLDVTWPAREPFWASNHRLCDKFSTLWGDACDSTCYGTISAIRAVLERAPAAWAEFDRMHGVES